MTFEIRIGTSGWNYDHWQPAFYPEGLPKKRWFSHYCGTFDTVEINNTFYRQPSVKTFEEWREQAPADFLYAVKANRFLTHMKKLKNSQEPLERFFEGARELKQHLGPVLFQLPPNWKRNLQRLREFAELLPKDGLYVMEFRDRDWLCQETYDLLEEWNLSLCVHDILPRHPRRAMGPVGYVRLHGAGGKYSGKYPRRRLRAWADWIHEIAAKRRVFVYFNNDAQGHAVRDAQTLRKILNEEGPSNAA